jgi:peptidoglycan/LPS O-acetylase OafA/YrhL
VSASRTDAGIDGGRIVVAIGAALLFASLFVNWYGFGQGPDADGFTAWTAFELVDLLLAVLALSAIAAALEPFVRASSRIPAGFTAAAGPAALLLVVVSIINEPPAAQGFDAQLEVGAWLALAGAAIMCAGALLAGNRVSLVVTPRERASNAPAPPPSPADETETRPL